MQDRYLEITFRKGKPLAAYIYLSGKVGLKAATSRKYKEGIIVDFDNNNMAIGVEITSPLHSDIQEINSILNQLHVAPISEREFSPLKAA